MTRTASEIGKSNVSRSKAHERQVAKSLTAWSGVPFRRRLAEGRGASIIEIEGAADVIAIGADFHFSVEAKCGSGFSFNAMFMDLAVTIFTGWWHQATYDANIMTKSRGRQIYPMVFFRPSPGANWIAFPVKAIGLFRVKPGLEVVKPVDGLWFHHLIFSGYSRMGPMAGNVSHSPKNKNIVSLELDDVVMCRWSDFADNVDPDSAFAGGIPAMPEATSTPEE